VDRFPKGFTRCFPPSPPHALSSVTSESPVIKSVYSTLREAEHRSMSFVPYWKLPFADKLLKDQVLPSRPPARPLSFAPSFPPSLPHFLHFSRS
jgi:hypothetical protein